MPTSHRFSLARIAGATGLCLSLAAPLGAQTLVVDPAEALVDGPLSVRVSGLSAGQAFIVRSEAKDADGRIWQAWAGYLANGAGEGDVSSEPPRHGSFTTAGAGSQGLLTSMDLAGESRGRARFSWPGSEPIEIRLTLEIGGRAASTATAIRRFRAPEGRVVELREEGLVGRLFLPDGAGPFPGVLVLGGSEGKLSSEPLAALLRWLSPISACPICRRLCRRSRSSTSIGPSNGCCATLRCAGRASRSSALPRARKRAFSSRRARVESSRLSRTLRARSPGRASARSRNARPGPERARPCRTLARARIRPTRHPKDFRSSRPFTIRGGCSRPEPRKWPQSGWKRSPARCCSSGVATIGSGLPPSPRGESGSGWIGGDIREANFWSTRTRGT
jgi:hypothetical protein